MRIKMLGTFKRAFREEDLTFPTNVEVSKVIEKIARGYGEENLSEPAGQIPLQNAIILLNGVEIGNLEGLRTPVEDNDTLVFISVTHGG